MTSPSLEELSPDGQLPNPQHIHAMIGGTVASGLTRENVEECIRELIPRTKLPPIGLVTTSVTRSIRGFQMLEGGFINIEIFPYSPWFATIDIKVFDAYSIDSMMSLLIKHLNLDNITYKLYERRTSYLYAEQWISPPPTIQALSIKDRSTDP